MEQLEWEGVSAVAEENQASVLSARREKRVWTTAKRCGDSGTRDSVLGICMAVPSESGAVLWCVGTWWEERNCRRPSPGPEGEKRNGHWGRGQSTIDAVTGVRGVWPVLEQ